MDVCMNVTALCAAEVGADWQQPSNLALLWCSPKCWSHLYELRKPVCIYSVTVLVDEDHLLNDTCQELGGKTTCSSRCLLSAYGIEAPKDQLGSMDPHCLLTPVHCRLLACPARTGEHVDDGAPLATPLVSTLLLPAQLPPQRYAGSGNPVIEERAGLLRLGPHGADKIHGWHSSALGFEFQQTYKTRQEDYIVPASLAD